MTNEQKISFLSLVRLGIGHPVINRLDNVDWETMGALAMRQGLSAVIVDSVEYLPETLRPPKGILLQWIGNTLQSFEYRYELYCRAIVEMATWYNSHGIKMMVLKGYACSLDWPKPKHRPCGDIDIFFC